MECALLVEAMKLVIGLTLITAFFFTACAPSGGGQPASVSDTQKFDDGPIVHQAGKYQVYEGLTQAQDMKVDWEASTKKYSLKGKLRLQPVLSREQIDIDLDLIGTAADEDTVVLKPSTSVGVEGMQIAAKATCLGVNGDCGNSYVDIYVAYDEKIYHHQIQNLAEIVPDPEDPSDDQLHDDDFHEDTDFAQDGPGYSVDFEDDIDKTFDVKPIPQQPKKDEPKKEQPKKEEPKKEDPKAEEPKKEEPKNQDPKKEEPKKEEPKKDEPKKEDPKQDPPKVNPPKKEEPKKDPPKKEQPKPLPQPKPAPIPKEEKPEDRPAPLPADFPRYANQAIGTVNNGRLQNGIDLWAYEKSMTA
ncbi:MAG: hypothetical protein J7501_01055, partial [Bdellovibrio sp.]|nr:hypothetical protein [Bdellovibrio sp.]